MLGGEEPSGNTLWTVENFTENKCLHSSCKDALDFSEKMAFSMTVPGIFYLLIIVKVVTFGDAMNFQVCLRVQEG